MPPLSLLIKPVSSNCNLRCKYCFYHSIAEQREVSSFGTMMTETLQAVVKKALLYASQSCTFGFQGGEPTLAGLNFFKKLIEFENLYNVNSLRIFNTIQTNGIVIDDEWANFLAENKFLVGLSLDGPAKIHNINRIDAKGNGSFNKVMNAVRLFNKYGVEYNILFVVTASTAGHVDSVYGFFAKHNFKYIQFIPCLDPLGENPGHHEYSLQPGAYSFFLKRLFDNWYNDIINNKMISIRYFDNIVGMVMGYMPEACGMLGECQCQFIVEADGGVYPCDFYVLDEWFLGNINERTLKEIKSSEKCKIFLDMSRDIHIKCRTCRWYNLCRGGCRRSREPCENGKPVLNYFCSSYGDFFHYAAERICKVANMLSCR